MALRTGLVMLWVMAATVAGCGNRGGGGDGMSAFVDAGRRMDGAPAEEDAGPGGARDTGPGGERDTGPGTRDAGTPPPGQCDPSCLMLPGAICCTACGCGGGSGSCMPVCPEPYLWDCEVGCCFDYEAVMCMP